MYKTNEIIKLNNKYREELNAENRKYYEDILVYIRCSSFLKNDRQTEESLLEILTDIIEAQNQGISAKDYFGKDPKLVSDDIIKNLSIASPMSMIKFALGVMLTFLTISFLLQDFFFKNGFDLGKALICSIILCTLVVFMAREMSKSNFECKSKKVVSFIKLYTYILLFGGICAAIAYLIPSVFKLNMSNTIEIIIAVAICVITSACCLKQKELYTFIPLIIGISCYGIISRIESIKEIADSIFTFEGILIVSAGISFLINRVQNKKKYKN